MAEESLLSSGLPVKRQKVDKIALLKEKLALLPTQFELPSWAGDPPAGLHVDVMKDGKLIQKSMIDEKPCYLFGRNREVCDFALDHESASRLHAAFVWHKQLQRAFLIDCGSVHGTFIGKLRLEANKPTQVSIGSELHFGASTRTYIVRERPKSVATFNPRNLLGGSLGHRGVDADGQGEDDEFRTDDGGNTSIDGGTSNLPESESEIDNLTEFNTMHNRRVGTLTDIIDPPRRGLDAERRSRSIRFRDQIDVINPEDVDPSIGRFRNLCSTTVILNTKQPPASSSALPSSSSSATPVTSAAPRSAIPASTTAVSKPRMELASRSSSSASLSQAVLTGGSSVLAKLGISVNIAPDIVAPEPVAQDVVEPDLYYGTYAEVAPVASLPSASVSAPAPVSRRSNTKGPSESTGRSRNEDEPRKKKYAKEAWPGRHPPTASLHS